MGESLTSTEQVLYKITGNIIVRLPKEHGQRKLKQEGTYSMLWQLSIIFYFAWDMKYPVLYSGTVLRFYAGHFIMSDCFSVALRPNAGHNLLILEFF
jgi:hypothetical protein